MTESNNKPSKKLNTTILLTKEEAQATQKWFLFDASGKTLGRFAAEIAKILRGKHKATFTSNVDTGDGVVILNASKIKVTGNKEAQKIYRYHTGAMSGMREVPYRVMQARKPDYIIRHAVKGMMPKTRLGEAQMKKLRIFADDQHDLQAQQPVEAQI
jgi:large subunit ribosomal protein L13